MINHSIPLYIIKKNCLLDFFIQRREIFPSKGKIFSLYLFILHVEINYTRLYMSNRIYNPIYGTNK